MNQDQEEAVQQRPRSGIRNQQKPRGPIQPGRFQQQPKMEEFGGLRLSAKERLWVWECRYVWGMECYVAYNRDTNEERQIGCGKEHGDRAARIVQSMNLAITEK